MKKFDSIKEREKLVASCMNAIKELDKVINQEIQLDELDPEKAKQAAQGKIEAIQGYDRILGIISQQLITIENERNAKEGKSQAAAFSGVEGRAK